MEKVENKRKMEKLKNTIKNMNGLAMCIIINILYIFIASFLVTIKKITYGNMSKGFIPLLILNVIVGVIIALKGKYKKSITHLFILLIIIFGIISTIFAIKPKVAVWGIGGRYEGLITIIYYFSLTFLSGFLKEKYKKRIAIIILLTGLVQFVYAICQIYEVEGVYKMIHTWNEIKFMSYGFEIPSEIWATGFATNPNFFASYMLLCSAYSLGLFLDEKNTIKSLVFLVITALFIFGILISNTMSCVLGLAVVVFYILIYCLKNKYIKKVLLITIITIIVIFTGVKTGKTRLIKESKKFKNETTQIAQGNTKNSYGTDRIYIWKNTFNILPKYILHGVGIDNFYYAFDGKALVSENGKFYFDKVHNEYLQILITEGIFCVLVYIMLYSTIGIKEVIRSYKNKEVYLILPIIGYLVQAFFNISVIEVAPLFYITLGLCIFHEKEEDK